MAVDLDPLQSVDFEGPRQEFFLAGFAGKNRSEGDQPGITCSQSGHVGVERLGQARAVGVAQTHRVAYPLLIQVGHDLVRVEFVHDWPGLLVEPLPHGLEELLRKQVNV